jgi:very-short-patch-repair endonuclease
MDDALRRKMTSVARLRRFIDDESAPGRRGTKTMRRLITGRDHRDERVRSMLETKMLRILRRIKGLQFLPNHPIQVERSRYVIDFFLPAAFIGIECHSRRWHDVERSGGDIRRHRKLVGAGIEVLYFDWDDVTFAADETREEIRAAIARRLTRTGS